MDFFFMRANVLVDFLLEFKPELDLVFEPFPDLATVSLQIVHFEFEFLLICLMLHYLEVEVFFHLCDVLHMFGVQLGELHLIVRLAAVFEQDAVNFPD